MPDAIWGAVAGYLSLWSVYWLFKLTTGKEGMGFGDFKLLAALGAWLGWKMILPIVLGASIIGALVGIGMKMSAALARRPLRPVRAVPRRRRAGGPVRRPGARPRLAALVLTRPRRALVMKPLRIGLTGGIGSGKSTVGAILAGLGAVVIDTDLIARQLTLPGGAAMAAIGAAFGPEFIAADGSLDRPRMRAAAFADDAARHRLEAILHPLIGVEVERAAAAAPASATALVFDVPLLVESGRWRERVDYVWVVDCDEAVQVARVAARPGWSAEAARAVIAQQVPRGGAARRADAVIDNSGAGLDALAREVQQLWQDVVARRP